eukprot:6191033-Pleurochrysis_carterae.AAC.2
MTSLWLVSRSIQPCRVRAHSIFMPARLSYSRTSATDARPQTKGDAAAILLLRLQQARSSLRKELTPQSTKLRLSPLGKIRLSPDSLEPACIRV